MPASVLVRATRAREDDVKFKQIWNIWYPQEETFSVSIHCTVEKASQKLNQAISQYSGMSGFATEKEVFIRHITPRRPQQQIYKFNGRWRNEGNCIFLTGNFYAPAIEKIIATLIFIFCIGMVLTAISAAANWLPKKNSLELFFLCLLVPIAILPSCTFIFTIKNKVNSRQKKVIKRMISQALN